MKRTIAVLFLIALCLIGQTRIVSPSWVTGNGVAQQVNATEQARSLTVFALPTNSATNCSTTDLSKCPVTGGDSTIAMGSKGIPLLPGASYTYPTLPQGQPGYSLAQIYWLAATGDKVSFLWAK